jgi:hypothetical protein
MFFLCGFIKRTKNCKFKEKKKSDAYEFYKKIEGVLEKSIALFILDFM